MEIVWRLLATALGLFGGLSLILFVRRLAAGEGVSWAPIFVSVAGLLLAWACLRKAGRDV
jgi:hypothetical protein